MKLDEHIEAATDAWRRVLVGAGAAQAAGLAGAAVALLDVEAAAVAAATLVALALLRFRTGLIGIVGLGVLSVNNAAWMAPAAVSNLMHAEGTFETVLPAGLTVAAVVGLAAAVGALAFRRGRGAATLARPVGIAGAVLLAVAVVVSLLPIGTRAAQASADATVVAENTKFSVTRVEVETGEVIIAVDNRDLFWHTFTVSELGVNLKVPVGGERVVTFDAVPGSYEFVCAVPGHTQAGMKGTLVVG